MSEEDIKVWLTRVEVKLDTAIARVDDHEQRMRFLERVAWAGLALGGTGALSGLWAVLGG